MSVEVWGGLMTDFYSKIKFPPVKKKKPKTIILKKMIDSIIIVSKNST